MKKTPMIGLIIASFLSVPAFAGGSGSYKKICKDQEGRYSAKIFNPGDFWFMSAFKRNHRIRIYENSVKIAGKIINPNIRKTEFGYEISQDLWFDDWIGTYTGYLYKTSEGQLTEKIKLNCHYERN